MAILIEGETANDVWSKAADMLLSQSKTLNSRDGEIKELLHVLFSVREPLQRWVYDRIPPISIGFALAELVWIMNGENNADIINFWNPALPKHAGKGKTYYGAYGNRIRNNFGFDQLCNAYYALQNAPESRQVVIQIYDTKLDFPNEDGSKRSMDIPCNICSMLKVREEKLEWSQTLRSNDIFLGVPYNFVQFTSIQEILAGWLGIQVGSYNHYSDSLHLYTRDIEKIGVGKETKIKNEDSLSLTKIESEKMFAEIYKRMKFIMDPKISEKDLLSLGFLDSQYVSYNNIMFIISAYAAQKYGYLDILKEFINHCTNNIFVSMWTRWYRLKIYKKIESNI